MDSPIKNRWFPCGLSLIVLLASSVCTAADAPPMARTPGYELHIEPILRKHCLGCHGRRKQEGGLRLDNKEGALVGGDSGKAIVPGNSDASPLVGRLTSRDIDERMPLDRPPLRIEEISRIKQWIDAGAPWEDDTRGNTTKSDHWTFQPIQRPTPPRMQDRTWLRNGIDAFILAKLERHRIRPSPRAKRYVLIRRLSLDLTGLPPTPEDVASFVADPRPEAYAHLVERLLASPHFGERWGRHWLDLARYADSDGYEMDHPRPHAWRWRDWVIGAVNADTPFSQFTVEQLAGDLLPGATLSNKIATGFHRNTLTNRENGIDKEEFRRKAVVDRVNTTGTVWLGLTLGCAECHSHKYDPISQREYYRFFAFFNDAVDEVDMPVPASIFERAPSSKEKAPKPIAHAFGKREQMRVSHVHLRGNFLDKGAKVVPGTPSVLPSLEKSREPKTTLDRLDLARWIVDPANPLTARVAANRIWQHLFGVGIVGTPEDFGSQGLPPTHPALLDWLASELIRNDWSRKDLIRIIVHSSTYQQASRHRPDLLVLDPNNGLLARQNRMRLEAEVVRDQYLTASGMLRRRIGGPGFRPPMPDGLDKIGFRLSWRPDGGEALFRRGMYIVYHRNLAYPMLKTFDYPNSNVACTRRERSNTPLQALTQLNDSLFVETARALGRRLFDDATTPVERIDRAYLLCLSRTPSAKERDILLQHYHQLQTQYRATPTAAKVLVGKSLLDEEALVECAVWIALARTIVNLDEFITRE